MKKIQSEKDVARRQRMAKIVVGIVLAFLMAFSTLGFALYGHGSGGSSQTNAHTESVDDGPVFNGQYWVYQASGQEFYFTNKPGDLGEVSIDINLTLQNYAGTQVYLVAEEGDATNQLALNLGRYASHFQRACFGACEEDLPEKDCSDTLIIVRESNKNAVSQEGSCAFIEGDIAAVDAFLYRIFGLA